MAAAALIVMLSSDPVLILHNETRQRDKKDSYYMNRYGEGITLSNQKGLPTNNDRQCFCVSIEALLCCIGLSSSWADSMHYI